MIDLITKSQIRKNILLLLFSNQNESFYINQIARLIKTSSGNVQRELRNLEKAGILLKEKKGNLSYFRVNVDSSLFSDIKGVIDKTIGIKYILETTFSKEKSIDFAFIFGSYAKGEFKSDSDIDLYIIGSINEEDLHRLVRGAEEKIYREINYHLSDGKEFKEKAKKSFFHKQILEHFIIIKGDENEFRELIK
jgi:predicted nucleotidyltransferase